MMVAFSIVTGGRFYIHLQMYFCCILFVEKLRKTWRTKPDLKDIRSEPPKT